MPIASLLSTADHGFEAFSAFAGSHPKANYFQSVAFFQFVQTWPEADAVLLISTGAHEQVNGTLLGIVLREHKGLISRLSARTVIYGGPMLIGTEQEQAETLQNLLQALIKRVRNRSLFIQFRNFMDWTPFNHIFEANGFRRNDRLNLLVDTSTEAIAWAGMSASRRRQVNASIRNGAEVITTPDIGQVAEFYALLSHLYRTKVRKPLPSKAFFISFHRWVEAGNPGAIILIKAGGQIIGGILCPFQPGTAMYEWYVCGLDQEYRQKGIFPSVLATWSAIKMGAAIGIPQFDFMGMGRPDKVYGVRDFKVRFGGSWVNNGRFARINNGILYAIAELGYNILRLVKKV